MAAALMSRQRRRLPLRRRLLPPQWSQRRATGRRRLTVRRYLHRARRPIKNRSHHPRCGGRHASSESNCVTSRAAARQAASNTVTSTRTQRVSARLPLRAIQSELVERDATEEIPVIGLRRKIAQKMQEAKRRIPHFAYVEEVDVTELEKLRAFLNETRREDQPKLTLLPFIMRAVVLAVADYPQINAHFDDDAGIITRHRAVHLGIATQTKSGLVVPVVKHAEARDIWESAAEVSRLAGAARDGKADRGELSGSTITISSLGPLGGIVSTPIINHPEVAIVGINRIVERPMFVDGAVIPRKLMNLSSSFDHRVVDGQDAAEFIQRVRRLLEVPATLFMPSA